jgi:hypothetical protein
MSQKKLNPYLKFFFSESITILCCGRRLISGEGQEAVLGSAEFLLGVEAEGVVLGLGAGVVLHHSSGI